MRFLTSALVLIWGTGMLALSGCQGASYSAEISSSPGNPPVLTSEMERFDGGLGTADAGLFAPIPTGSSAAQTRR